jgi:hypothetical protein
VIEVLGVGPAADRAHATLPDHELVELIGADAVATLQVVATRAAVPFVRLLAARVVTRLAVAVAAVLRILVPRELVECLPLTAVRAALHGARLSNWCSGC